MESFLRTDIVQTWTPVLEGIVDRHQRWEGRWRELWFQEIARRLKPGHSITAALSAGELQRLQGLAMEEASAELRKEAVPDLPC